jgi:archaellum component FlaC
MQHKRNTFLRKHGFIAAACGAVMMIGVASTNVPQPATAAGVPTVDFQGNAIMGFIETISSASQAIMSTIQDVQNGINQAIGTVGQITNDFIAPVTGAIDDVKSFAGQVNAVYDQAKGAIDGVKSTITTIKSDIDQIVAMPGQIKGEITAATQNVTSAFNDISSALDQVQDKPTDPKRWDTFIKATFYSAPRDADAATDRALREVRRSVARAATIDAYKEAAVTMSKMEEMSNLINKVGQRSGNASTLRGNVIESTNATLNNSVILMQANMLAAKDVIARSADIMARDPNITKMSTSN